SIARETRPLPRRLTSSRQLRDKGSGRIQTGCAKPRQEHDDERAGAYVDGIGGDDRRQLHSSANSSAGPPDRDQSQRQHPPGGDRTPRARRRRPAAAKPGSVLKAMPMKRARTIDLLGPILMGAFLLAAAFAIPAHAQASDPVVAQARAA